MNEAIYTPTYIKRIIMNHTHVLALLLLLPPFLAIGTEKEERIQQLEERIQILQYSKAETQMTLMMAPWTLCCLSEAERDDLKSYFMEYDAELRVLYRELIHLLTNKE